MRTERFRRILEAAGSADLKWFASEKQHMEKRERRFVGFVEPSNRRFFAFQDRSRAAARRGESKWQEKQIKVPVMRCCG